MKQVLKTQTILPEGYVPKLDYFETQRAVLLVKELFSKRLSEQLCLIKVASPLFLKEGKGLQDDLAGTQLPVSFETKFTKSKMEMVHSLAKWKRYILGKHHFRVGTGIYTDMDAVRKDEQIDALHSIYVDQWDWEMVIGKEQRTLEFLKSTITKIYAALLATEAAIAEIFPELKPTLPKTLKFIHSEDLEARYPDKTPFQREQMAAKEYGAFFLIGIGYPLKSGKPHDQRAADYDDWSAETAGEKHGLNGDIIVWHPPTHCALEIMSGGIRVDKAALEFQLVHLGLSRRKQLAFHKLVLESKLPMTIGGGIGQSRVCMRLLQKAHIGEVQASSWSEEVEEEFAVRDIPLL
ncbi:MAG: aspartate--ammonia ligase [Candidatus Woesearchaeota archaeon]